ncbi:MAG: hypothetical protein M3O21_01385 [Chloroflexota bacterium]|nr:hypothetical protein [Chloroflexota bacterium]
MAAAAQAGVLLQVGFNRRFDASFAHVHDQIVAGAIGAPQIIHIVSRDPEPADGRASRTPADLILETTIHDLDMACYLAGSEITSVHALGLPASEPGRLDGAIIVLRLANGVVCIPALQVQGEDAARLYRSTDWDASGKQELRRQFHPRLRSHIRGSTP